VTDTNTPLTALLARAGGVRGLIYSSLPVTVFAVANTVLDLGWSTAAAVGVAAVILAWQLLRRESLRPALFGFAGVAVGAPLVGVGWAWVTGRDDTWRRVRRVRLAFDLVTVVMALASWARFVVQYYLYDTDQAGLLAAARIAMGWPIFLVTSSLIYLAVRAAIRTLPRTAEAAD
jgi:hypothetical protein